MKTYLCVILVIIHNVCASTGRRRRDDASVDYDALNSQIDAFTASLNAAYTTFDYNNIVSNINSLAGGLTGDGITITPLPNYSAQTAQPEATPVTPSVFVSDIINSYSSIAAHSPQQSNSPSTAGIYLKSSYHISMQGSRDFVVSTSFTQSVLSGASASTITAKSEALNSATVESHVSTNTASAVSTIPFVGSSSYSSSPSNTKSDSQGQSSSNSGTQAGLGSGSSASYTSTSSRTSQLSATGTSTIQNLGGQAVGTSQATSTAPQNTPKTSALPAKGMRLSTPGSWSITMGILLVRRFVSATF